jgi:hypothetical protein
VTHITLKTYPLGPVWGGVIAYNDSYTAALMQAFATYQASGQFDTKSAIITDMVITQNLNIVTLIYLAPVSSRPAAFAPFYDIPALYDLTGPHNNFTDLIGPPLNTGLPRYVSQGCILFHFFLYFIRYIDRPCVNEQSERHTVREYV